MHAVRQVHSVPRAWNVTVRARGARARVQEFALSCAGRAWGSFLPGRDPGPAYRGVAYEAVVAVSAGGVSGGLYVL
jgi:hypothetical protein